VYLSIFIHNAAMKWRSEANGGRGGAARREAVLERIYVSGLTDGAIGGVYLMTERRS
jgi:hypothetical protein